MGKGTGKKEEKEDLSLGGDGAKARIGMIRMTGAHLLTSRMRKSSRRTPASTTMLRN